jgi:hypothetical protein
VSTAEHAAGPANASVRRAADATDIAESVEAAGHFRIYLGAAAGVGKTTAMLDEGHRRRQRGADVVIAVVECHGRPMTEARIAGLETIPRQPVEYRGASTWRASPTPSSTSPACRCASASPTGWCAAPTRSS